MSDVWAYAPLLFVSTYWEEIRRMLWEPHENPEKRVQVRLNLCVNFTMLLCSTFILKPLIFDLLFRLLGYLQAMRNYFLLEAGDTMYDFYTAIFDKVLEKESWQQLAFLNVQLQEAVGQRHPEESSRYCTWISRDPVVTLLPKPCLITLYILWLFIFPTHILLMIPGCLYFLKPLTL